MKENVFQRIALPLDNAKYLCIFFTPTEIFSDAKKMFSGDNTGRNSSGS